MNFSLSSPSASTPTPPPAARELPELQRPSPPRPRRKGSGGKLLAAGVVAVAAAGGVVALTSTGLSKTLRPVLGGLIPGATSDYVLTFAVKTTNLPVTVVSRGNLESSSNKDVYCQVEGQTTIITIVPEGKQVKKGDVVCELDSAALKDQLTNQEITTRGAKAAYDNARLTREVAEIAVVEYEQGIFKQDRETALGEIALAKSDRKRAEDRLEWSSRMLKKGYVSLGQNISEKLSLQRAIFAEEQAQTKMNVLEKFTKDKTIKELRSEVEKTRSDELAKQATWDLEKTKEEKLRRQIRNCTIVAPDDGIVVYANDPNRFGGQNQLQIEEGATVRERQKIFSLPDISQMQVNTKVHESMVDRIARGLRARVKVDAFAEEVLPGVVDDVAPLPDPTSFFSSDVKVYTTKVKIEKGLPGLRPGMTAEVTILVTELDNVLTVPVQAVLQYGNKDHVAVKRADGTYDWKDVALGISNDKYIEVKSGLNAGDLVALNPIALMSEDEKRERFGSSSKDAGKTWGDVKKIGQAPTPGAVPGAPGDATKAGGDPAKAKAKAKGARPAMPAALKKKMDAIPKEERSKMRGATPEEREEILKKAGFTEDEMKQYNAFMEQMRSMFRGGGGGGGFGGPGGPGGGGGFDGPGGPGGGGGGGGFGGPGGPGGPRP